MKTGSNSKAGREVAGFWHPLRVATFRHLLLADVVSDVGTFMQSVGAAWLMVSLGGGPGLIALTQTASSLPYFLLALPAGSVGDIVDRRKLILATETWMAVVAVVIAGLTIGGRMTPWLLLGLTFALSAGDAFETPTWRAILPELVGREDLAAASALNGIEFNLARAVGPALAGMVIAAAGVATAFAINAVSFLGVIGVVGSWRRPAAKAAGPRESLAGATVAALRYVRHSPAIVAVVLRAGVVMFFASALFALLPAVARGLHGTAIAYGLLLGCFGAGAIGGAALMPGMRARFGTEGIVTAGVMTMGLAIVALGRLHSLAALMPVMAAGGGAWVTFISLINTRVQNLAPNWVRARVLAVFILVYQGGSALGSAVWGGVAERAGIATALLAAGVGAMAAALLALLAPLPDAAGDLTPWVHWRAPAVAEEMDADPDQGPVLVMVEYRVEAAKQAEFTRAIHGYARMRRRDGAYRWGVFRDTENAERYVETFLVDSWAEHLRQHERPTLADRELERQVRACTAAPPVVRHLLYAEADSGR